MATDLVFPLALCRAQWRMWLHALEILDTLGAQALEGHATQVRAVAHEVTRTEDWQALMLAPARALWLGITPGPRSPHERAEGALSDPVDLPAVSASIVQGTRAEPRSRRTEVREALHMLHEALAARPVPRRVRVPTEASAAVVRKPRGRSSRRTASVHA